ncbi:MAG: LamG-like jellyroll fold domain-containing protein [Nostoc sp.]|uniref:LamG-like jellyroll fold domain-containing protein n=1 Tax=Nostoc sp. TaxID=1180 RepID=UPI002FF58A9D
MAINNSKQVLFVDSTVENYQDLVNNVTSGIEVVVLNGSRDGITQITEALTGREGITSIQIISHGGEGEIRLGTTLLNSANLQEYSQQLQQWRKALTAEADILLFGCSVGSGVGEDFIRDLSEVTGADVAASTDVTGNAKLGGDWDLEVQTGSIESSLAISDADQQSYTNVLALKAEYYNDKDKDVEGSLSDYKGTNIVDNINYSQSNDNIAFLGGNDDRGIKWTGYVYAPNAGTYTFFADIDDGVVLYVNGQKIINQWNNATDEYSGNISLTGGQWYPIEMKFQNDVGDWRAILSWSGPSISKQVIPADKFIVPNIVPPQKEQYLAVNDSEVNYSIFGYTLKSTGEEIFKKSSNNYYKFVPNPYQIWVNASSTTVKEGETVNFTITSDRDVSGEVKVFYKIETISGADSSDVSIPQPQPLYYAKLSGNSATVRINIVDDRIGGENGEQFRLTLVPDPQSSNTYSINTSSTTVTIQDNEPIFELRQSSGTTQEGGSSPKFILTNTNPVRTNRDITFYYKIDLDSASYPRADSQDFTTISSSVVFPSGVYSQEFTLPIINDDKLYEGQTEYFRIVGVYSPEYRVNYDLVDYSLFDNEPQISLQNYRSQTQEGAPFSGSGDGLFQVNFSRATPQQFDLQLFLGSPYKPAIAGSFVATKKGSDYKIYYYLQAEGYQNRKYLIQNPDSDPSNLKIDVPAGNKNSIFIGVEPIDDDIYDPDETVTLSLVNHATGLNQYYGIHPTLNSATITIKDNEPIVSLGNVVHPQEGFGYGSTIIGLEQALELKGTNSVNVASKPSLDLSKTGQFTQEAWIFANFTDNNRHGILGNGTTATSYAGISVINQTGIEVGFGDGTNWNSFQVDNLLTKNNWNHVATTFDGTEYSLYVNGLKVSSTTQFQGKIPTNASSFDIGKVGTNTFIGAIDEVRLWNVARTSAQINQNLITDLQGNEKGLIGYWQFNNNTQDKTANQNHGIASYTLNYIKNPATQIGYVDVTLDKDVTAPQGLWIAYSLGGTATSGQDYWSSQIRKVSSDPNSQLKGIVVPQGERSGRIYFTALPDGISESDETIQVTLMGYDFDRETRTYDQNASNYGIDPNNSSRTLTIQDNQAFQYGVVILNEFNEVVNASNPLSVKNGSTTFNIKLASQPNFSTNIYINPNPNLGQLYEASVVFYPENWNIPQTVTLPNIPTAQTQLKINDNNTLRQNVPLLTVPLTTNPSDKVRVTEGSLTDAVAITPEISIIRGGNANETDAEGGQFTIRLKNPAPAAGLTVNYAVSGTATLNTDYAIAGHAITAIAGGSKAIQFDGTNYVKLPASSSLSLSQTKKFTLSAWIKPTSNDTTERSVFGSLTNGNEYPALRVAGNILWFTTGDIKASTANVIKQNEWNHIAYTFDGSTYRAYVNGAFVGLLKSTQTHVFNTQSLAIGSANGGSNFIGAIDDVQIWNKVLSEAEIKNGLTTELQGNEVGLVGNWQFNNNTEDSSLNKNNGSYQTTANPVSYINTQVGSITIAPGEIEATIAIAPIIDSKVEGNETVSITLQSSTGYNIKSGVGNATLTLVDSDVAGVQLSNIQVITNSTTQAQNTTFSGTFSPLITEEKRLTTAIQFDSTNYVKLPASSSLSLSQTKKFTLSAWIKPTTNDTIERSVFGSLVNDKEYPGLRVAGNTLWFTTGDIKVSTANVIKQNEWNHIAYTFDGSTYRAYVNGVSVGFFNSTLTHVFNTQSLAIGSANGGSNFIGAIDDVRIWNKVLSEADIKNGLTTQLQGNEAGLIGNWQFNNNTEDSSLNKNNGAYQTTANPVTYTYIQGQVGTFTESAFGLRLSSKPSDNVTIAFSGLDATEGTLSKSSVIFTPANWHQYQTVTVTGVDDVEKDGDITYLVIGTTSSDDKQYQNKKIPIQITNLDNEKQILKTAEEVNTALGGDPNQVNTTLPLATIKVLNATAIEVDKLTGSAIAPQIEINLDKPAGNNGALVSFDLAGGSAIYAQDINTLQNIFIEKTGTNNPFNGINVGENSRPTFADIDQDGDLDLFVGTGKGLIKFYKNQGSVSNPLYSEQTEVNNPLNNVDVGSNAAPAFVDIDGDGDLDVFVGTGVGTVSYYKNFGTVTSPQFQQLTGGGNPLEEFRTAIYFSVYPTFGDIDGNGTQDAILGTTNTYTYLASEVNRTQLYFNYGSKTSPNFTLNNSYYTYQLPTIGVTTLSDLDFDGDLDLLSGSLDYHSGRFDGKIQTSLKNGGRYQTLSGDANPFKDIAVKSNSIPAPILVNLDGDIDQDLVIGGADGTLKYYQQVQAVKIAPGETKATITLQTLPDNIDEDDETIQVNLRAGDGYRIDATKSTAIVTLQDDSDTVGITITKPSSSTTSEGGSFLNYSIQLNSQPTKTVKVSLGTTDSSEGQLKSQSSDLSSVSVLNLEFTPDNWNKPQAFTVVGQNDAIDDDNIDYKIISTINSQDAKYDGLKVESLFLTNTDDDNFGLVITEPGQTSEGRTNIYGVRLKSQPTGEVRVTLTPSDDQIQFNQKSAGKPITLTFNAKTWNLEQSVQVLAVDDAVVEYFHSSQIKITTESGKVLYGELDDATNGISSQATDLGTLKETLTLRDLAIGTSKDQDWYQFTLPDTGTVADYVQINFNNAVGDLDMKLYKASDLTNYISKSSSDTNNSEKLDFNGLAPGKYYIQVYGFNGTTNPNYTLTLTNEDSKYNNFTGLTKDVYIVDNDLPTAKIIAGPSASELFGQPSYFSVSLSNPAPRNSLSQNGIAVNYRLVGGTASNGNDYQLISPTGTVLIAPGNIQNNLLIVPIDDKLAEGLNLKVTGRTVGAASNNQTQMTLTVETTLAASAILNQGAKLKFAKGVIGEVISSVTLNPISTGSNIYRTTVLVNLNTFDVNSVQVNSLAKVAEETVTVELLAGDGYTLDNNNKIANIAIADDDVPGVRVVEVGYTTVAGESEAAQFEVSLLSEPTQDVKIRLTPGAEVEFVNPVNPTTVKVKKEVYTLNSFSSDFLDVKLNGLVPTNKGDALTFDVQLKKQPFEIVTVTLTDGFETASQATTPVTLTFTPDNWNQPQQSVVVSYLDRNSIGNYQINAQLKFDPKQTVKFDISDNSGDKYAIASSEVLDIKLLTATPTEQGNNNFAVKLNNKPLDNVTVTLADGFETTGKPTTTKSLTFTTTDWNTAQNVTLANLDKNSSDDYQIKVDVTGNVVTNTPLNLGITHSQIEINKQTTELTFKPEDWYKLQPIAVKGSDDNFSEPNLYHVSNIDYQVTSVDSGYNNFFVPQQTVFVVDRILSPQETSSTLKEGLGLLQESLGSLTVPILGGLDDIAPDLIGEFSGKLTSAIAKEENLTAIRLKEIIEGILGTLGAKSFDVEVEVNEDEVTVDLDLSKTYDLFKLSLDGNNLGLPALGISLTTKGELVSTFDYNLSLGFGLSKDFGFFIDTKKTGFHAGIDVGLSQDFTGQGNLSFLRLDFNNDPNNLSKLSFTVDAKLKDLDNHPGIRFFDVNGNGILDTAPFSFDLNKNGTIETTEQNLKEPFTQISAAGTYTELKPLANDPLDVNKDGKFNQAKYQKQEGIYRTATNATTGANTYYFDVNRNGKLDKDATGKALEPSTINASLFNTEFLLKKTAPMAAIGTVAVPESYIDFNNNNILDVGEKVNKAWDKNNDLKLNADINEIGEGKFINDVSIAFRDTNNNKQYDSAEKYIYSEFNPLEIDDEAKSEDGTYIDVDQDGIYAPDTWDVKILTAQNNGQQTYFLDINRNGILDKYEPQSTSSFDTLEIPGSDETVTIVDPLKPEDRKNALITLKILGTGVDRYIDQNNDGVYVEANDTLINTKVDLPDEIAKRAGIKASDPLVKITLKDIFRISDIDTSITFLDVDGDKKLDIGIAGNPDIYKFEPKLWVQDSKRFVDLDFNGELTLNQQNFNGQLTLNKQDFNGQFILNKQGAPIEPFADVSNEFLVEALEPATGSIVKLRDDGDRLTIAELKNFKNDPSLSFNDLIKYEFAGNANLGLNTKTSIEGNPAFPSIAFDLSLNLPLYNYGNQEQAQKQGLSVDFNNVELDFGSFLTNFIRPIMAATDKILDPIKPIVELLNADTKLLSYLKLDSVFNADGKPGISLLDIAKTLAPLSSDPKTKEKIDKAIKFADTLTQIIEIVDSLNKLPTNESIILDMGSHSLSDFKAASSQQKDATAAIKVPDTGAATVTGTGTTVTTKQPTTNPTAQAGKTTQSSILSKLQKLEGLQFPILSNPVTILRLLLGEKDVDLVKYDIPDFEFAFDIKSTTLIAPPLPLLAVVEGNFTAKTDLSVGYDTHGLEAWEDEDFALDEIYKVFDGFYVDDLGADGKEKPELLVNGNIKAGLAATALIITATVEGGIGGKISLDLVDEGELNGTSDGKIRGSEIISRLDTPLELFNLNGLIEAFLGAKVEVGIGALSSTVWETNFAKFKLAEFNVGASGNSFSSDLSGKAVDGFIAGGTVFLDANLNGVADDGEPVTVTNRNGQFKLVIPNATFAQFDTNQDGIINLNEGRLAMIGGIDSGSELPFEGILTAPVGSSTITPFTSLVERIGRQLAANSNGNDPAQAAKDLILHKWHISGLSLYPKLQAYGTETVFIINPDGSQYAYEGDREELDPTTTLITDDRAEFELSLSALLHPPALDINPDTGEYEQFEYPQNLDEASKTYLIGAQVQLISEQLAAFTGKPINQIIDKIADHFIQNQDVDLTSIGYIVNDLAPELSDNLKFAAKLAVDGAVTALTETAVDYGFPSKTYNIYDQIFRINGKFGAVAQGLQDLLGQIRRNELQITVDEFNNTFTTRALTTQFNNSPYKAENVFPPYTADFSRTITEDTNYTFAVADFPFTKGDTDDTLKSIIIETEPLLGLLKLGNQEITGNTEVSVEDIAAGLLTYTPYENLFGTPFDRFSFRVTDGKFFSDEIHNVTFEVTGINDAPVVSKNTGFVLEVGTTKTISRDILRATDSESPDGNLKFTLKALPQSGLVKLNGVDINVGDTFTQDDIDNEKVIYVQNGTRLAADSLSLEVSDPEGAKVDTLTVALTVQNPPTITAIDPQITNEDTATAIAFTIGDVETAIANLTITVTSSNQTLLPDNNLILSGIGSDRTLLATPAANLSGTAIITLIVNDGTDASQTQFEITVNPINDVPTLQNPIAAQIAKQDTAFSFTFDANTFIDVDPGDNLTYSATLKDGSNLPNWLKFNPDTRTFSGTPTNADVSILNIKLIATDTSAKTVNANFALKVENVNDAPTLQNAIADQIAKEDTVFSFTFDTNTFIDVDAGDNLTYSATLKDGSNLPSWLKFNAVTRTFRGTPTNADFGNLTIELRAKDNNGVSATDTFALAVEHNNGTPSFKLSKIADDIFKISNNSGKSKLKVTLTESSSNLVNELGVFTVDDAQGNINGIAPGAAGYTQAALERSQVILSAIANPPNGFNANNLSHLLELNSSDNLRFYLVKNSSIDAVRAGVTPLTEILFSDPLTQKITDLGADQFSLAWKDSSGNSTADFKDMVVKIQPTNDPLPLGTSLQGKPQGEVIDLRGVTSQVKANFVVNREAAFNNFIGFYQVTDENGGIDTNGDGKADILTGQAGYTEAAIRGRVAGIDLTVNNQGTATYTGTFQPGSIFAPFIIANGSPDALLDSNPNNNPAVYFPFLGANTDKVDHIRLLGNNVFGFEDLANGGDEDFNDVIVGVTLQ